MAELHGQVEDVKGVMNQNIEKILERGENLEQLQERTTQLNLNVKPCFFKHYSFKAMSFYRHIVSYTFATSKKFRRVTSVNN